MGIGVPHWDSELNGDGMATSGIQAGDTVVIALGINDQDFVGADPNKSTTLGAMGTYQAFRFETSDCRSPEASSCRPG